MKARKIVSMLVTILLVLLASVSQADLQPPAEVNQSGKYVVFGAYEQTYDTDGPEPIEWMVLAQDGTKLLLLCKNPIDHQQYSPERKDYTWKSSSIRSWLNSNFINTAFTKDEAAAILSVEVETKFENIEPEWPSVSTEITNDKVFLLSHTEYKKYLWDDKIDATEYVDQNDGLIFTKSDTWWLRSSGKKQNEACFVGHGRNESGWLTDWRCIRPAMWIDISLFDWTQSRYADAQKARNYAKDKQYVAAYTITDTLGDYWSSKYLSLDYRYNNALLISESGDYAESINRFQDVKNYINKTFMDENTRFNLMNSYSVNAQLLENKYLWAVQYKENGDFETAAKMFADIGQYKDSMNNLRACFDKLHIQYSWLPDNIVNAGGDGYKDTRLIEGGDPHFGWSLGRFMMSGFTEEKKNGDRTVFMKTPGDSLVLWFDLKQDIDALNGDKGMVINSDGNGYDTILQYPQQNGGIGKGLLLIRHTDFRNSTTAPQAYKDFLLAHEDTGANTKVEIKEEGIYEVALDYEVRKAGFVGIGNYTNYRISFSFEVRNGSGMFFLFDLGTGSELQDYSRTAEGFRIDLANSHSLSVSYKRYAMNQDETGLDVRKTGLAQDGDTFDKVGYYEITVTNKETQEELTKHIFVGRAADLAEYQAVDDTLAKFSN